MIEDLYRIVCKEFGITKAELLSTNRTTIYSDARKVVALVLLENGYNHEEIAKMTGTARSTITKRLTQAKNFCEVDKSFNEKKERVLGKFWFL